MQIDSKSFSDGTRTVWNKDLTKETNSSDLGNCTSNLAEASTLSPTI